MLILVSYNWLIDVFFREIRILISPSSSLSPFISDDLKKALLSRPCFFGIFSFFDFDATLFFSDCTFLSEGLTTGNAKKNPIITSLLALRIEHG